MRFTYLLYLLTLPTSQLGSPLTCCRIHFTTLLHNHYSTYQTAWLRAHLLARCSPSNPTATRRLHPSQQLYIKQYARTSFSTFICPFLQPSVGPLISLGFFHWPVLRLPSCQFVLTYACPYEGPPFQHHMHLNVSLSAYQPASEPARVPAHFSNHPSTCITARTSVLVPILLKSLLCNCQCDRPCHQPNHSHIRPFVRRSPARLPTCSPTRPPSRLLSRTSDIPPSYLTPTHVRPSIWPLVSPNRPTIRLSVHLPARSPVCPLGRLLRP